MRGSTVPVAELGTLVSLWLSQLPNLPVACKTTVVRTVRAMEQCVHRVVVEMLPIRATYVKMPVRPPWCVVVRQATSGCTTSCQIEMRWNTDEVTTRPAKSKVVV